ncbi:MAG: CBS domain-containing protein [Deltaproteobacteria bacterium]|nr:CBS domain-containing protein [Deltaproteobacteria bacterium]
MEVITTHRNVDFDALASVFAAAMIYEGAMPVLPRSLNANVRAFLALHKDLFPFHAFGDVDLNEVSRLVVVDAQNWSRLGRIREIRDREGLDIHLWDHHKETGDFQASWACTRAVGAASSLLVLRLERDQTPISPMQATLFLAGIYEDTGNMTFPSTRADDAMAVRFLLERKGDLSMVKNFLRPTYGPRQKEVLFEMLKTARREKLNGHTLCINTVEIEGYVHGLALVVDMLQDILNVDAAFGIFSERIQKRCFVIGRSAADTLDVGSIMQHLGGGGHPNAGSALLRSVNAEDVRTWILKLLKGNHNGAVQISDLMSYPVFSLSPGERMKKVALLLREKGCTGFPVTEGNKVVGIISRRDFRRVRKESQMSAPVKAFMSTDVHTIGPQDGVAQAVRLMVSEDIGRLPVVRDGDLIGILTRSDAMRYYYNLLPD